jgi:PAS domain S-box-containing protein
MEVPAGPEATPEELDGSEEALQPDRLLPADSDRVPALCPERISACHSTAKRRRLDQALDEGEYWFRRLAESTPTGIILCDPERRCLYANERWRTLTGLTTAECLGYGWSRALHPDDRDALLRGWSRSVRECREFSGEHRLASEVAGVRWVLVKVAVLRSKEGDVEGHIATFTDVTERKDAAEALRASEQRFRALTERSWDGISLVSEQGVVLYDNPAASTRILGYVTGELVGQSAFERMHPEDRPRVLELFGQLVQRPGANITAEFRYQHRDGSYRWLECVGTNLLGEPSVRAIVCNYRDVTERRSAEAEIRRRNRELSALNTISAAVSSSLELPEVLRTFKRQVVEELGLPGGMILFREADSGRFCLQEGWGVPKSILEELRASPLAASHFAEVIRGKGAVLKSDLREDALWFSLRLDVACPEWQSYLCVPLLAKDHIQGVVGLFSRAPSTFTEDQLAFFEALGQEVGAAIHHARQFEQGRAWRERLQAMSRRLVELQETERQHIARELHDEVGQLLTGLKLLLESSACLPPEGTQGRLSEGLQLLNELIERVRELSLDLRPAMLDDLGLLPTLLWHFDRYTAQTQIKVNFSQIGLERRFPSLVETAAFRIVQEALTNVARHARVDGATVHLGAESGVLRVQIRDVGMGFDPTAAGKREASCGLLGMRERAVLLGGQLQVESAPGAGVQVVAELPFHGLSTKERENDDSYGR